MIRTMKGKLITAVLLSTVCAPIVAEETKYKMAVVENSIGSSLIKKGQFQEAIDEISAAQFVEHQELIVASFLNLCVAHTSLEQWQLADEACDSAVTQSQFLANNSAVYRRLKSVALSNRAISKIKQDDFDDALKDLIAAVELKSGDVAEDNLLNLMQKQGKTMQFKSSSEA